MFLNGDFCLENTMICLDFLSYLDIHMVQMIKPRLRGRQQPDYFVDNRVIKYSLLMHCIKIKSPAKSLLNEQYVFVGGNIYFLCVLSSSSEEP